jgi:mono/diheme cytochrome c family protein
MALQREPQRALIQRTGRASNQASCETRMTIVGGSACRVRQLRYHERGCGREEEVPMATLRLLALIGILGILGAIGAAIFFFGGFYSVAGTQEEPDFIKSVLVQVRQASISRHAAAVGTAPANLSDAMRVQAGARAYSERGCVNCHGAPDVLWQKFSEGLRPDPPNLAEEIVEHRSAQELFWVVKNGINMTGMPSFQVAGVPDDEIWSIVAFLKELPKVTKDQFLEWSGTGPR